MSKLIVYLKERIIVVFPIGLCILMILHYLVSYGIMTPIRAYNSYLNDDNYALKIKTRIIDESELDFRYYIKRGPTQYEDTTGIGILIPLDELTRNEGYCFAYGYDGKSLYLALNSEANSLYREGIVARDVSPEAISISEEELNMITIGNKLSFKDYMKHFFSYSFSDGNKGMYAGIMDFHYKTYPFISLLGITWNIIFIYLIMSFKPKSWKASIIMMILILALNSILFVITSIAFSICLSPEFIAGLPMNIYGES